MRAAMPGAGRKGRAEGVASVIRAAPSGSSGAHDVATAALPSCLRFSPLYSRSRIARTTSSMNSTVARTRGRRWRSACMTSQ